MKGRKLTLEEVLDLEDGKLVWVEDDYYDDYEIGIIMKEDNTLKLSNGDWFCLSDLQDSKFVKFYEWIEEIDELSIPDKIETPYYSNSIVNKMSEEIVNLRGLDLTDDNIRLIVEEFEEEK